MTESVAMRVAFFGSISCVRRIGVVTDPVVCDRNSHHRICPNPMQNLPLGSGA